VTKATSNLKTSRPTIQSVAQVAGVSASTVSLVLQDKGNLPEKTRTRVMSAVERTGYERNRGRRMPQKRSLVGVIADDIENPYCVELCGAIDAAMSRRNCQPLLAVSHGSEERQVSILRTFGEMGCLGAFLVPANDSGQPTLDAIAHSRIPVVLGVRKLKSGAVDYVGPNYLLGMQLATRHILNLGHRRIAFVGGHPQNSSYAERLGGFRMSVSASAVPSIEAIEMSGVPSGDFGFDAMGRLLEMESPPTAIIGYNDDLCFGLMRGAHDAGLQVGRDITIVGFDDVQASARRTIPLTTVSTPPARIGEEMARLLEARLSDPEAPPVSFIPPPVLIIRESCGSAKDAHLRGQRENIALVNTKRN
jgi:LacI family transcriptional regulator